LQVLYLMTIQTRHQYYNTLENTEHSYQIIQGTWVSNYCYKTYWNKNRLFWYWNYRTWRTACGTCRYFIFIRKGKGYYVPFQKQRGRSSFDWQIHSFFENESIEKLVKT
jgi:DNA polymerase-1